MKRKLWIFFLLFVIMIGIVFVIGLSRKGKSQVSEGENTENSEIAQTVSSSAASISATDAETDDSDETGERDEEQEYFDQVAENKEKIEKEGNIFPKDSYQVFDGYGYQINEFKLFDSYEAFINSEYYNPDYEYLTPRDSQIEAQHKVAYVKYTVTNEDRYEKDFLTTTTCLIYAEDGVMRIHGGTNGGVDGIMQSKVDNWRELEDDKQWWYYPLEPGESATIEQAFLFCCATYDEEDPDAKITPVDFDSVVTDPKWYLQIQGNMPMSSWTGEDLELKEMITKIFIECE